MAIWQHSQVITLIPAWRSTKRRVVLQLMTSLTVLCPAINACGFISQTSTFCPRSFRVPYTALTGWSFAAGALFSARYELILYATLISLIVQYLSYKHQSSPLRSFVQALHVTVSYLDILLRHSRSKFFSCHHTFNLLKTNTAPNYT
jgi:hypothetical protein